MNIYVGNLAYSLTEQDLEEAFSEFGTVTSVKIVLDRDTGRSKGFAFVEMEDDEKGQDAINGLNDRELSGRRLKVNEARPKTNNSDRGGSRGPRRW
ncbi:MAG: RNA-binding protein [Bacteroidia bacterium]|nr:RNA-binding protein [Bacteroidia bacterium]